MNAKRVQSTNNFGIRNFLNPSSGFLNNSHNNNLNKIEKMQFSKLNPLINKKNINSISQNNFYNKSLSSSVNLKSKINTIPKNIGSKGNLILKHGGTNIIINNDLSQKKFEKSLKITKNPKSQNNLFASDHSVSPVNNSFEKSTNSINTTNDRIKVNKSYNNSKNNVNNSTVNHSNSDVLSSLLNNSKNFSKSPIRKDVGNSLNKNNMNILNKNPNSYNFINKQNNTIDVHGSNDLFNKLNNISNNSKKNLISSKGIEIKSKSPSPSPINSLNSLNISKINKKPNLNSTNFLNGNNFAVKKTVNSVNSQTIQANKIKGAGNQQKTKELRGTIIEINSEEFINKLTGKFGGTENEENKNQTKNNSGVNIAGNQNISRDNKFIAGNNLNSSINTSRGQNLTPSPIPSQLKNDLTTQNFLNNVKIKSMQTNNMNSFRDLNTSPFLRVNKKKFYIQYFL